MNAAHSRARVLLVQVLLLSCSWQALGSPDKTKAGKPSISLNTRDYRSLQQQPSLADVASWA
jgi:hypothetical protein